MSKSLSQIRESIIPSDTVKFVDLCLTDDEGLLQLDFLSFGNFSNNNLYIDFSEIKKSLKGNLLPITVRKMTLCEIFMTEESSE